MQDLHGVQPSLNGNFMKGFVFPGQGAQYIGMGKDFYENFSAAKEIFEFASDTLRKDLKKLIFESTEEQLKRTINTQPAMITVELAIYEVIKREFGFTPSITAGHSVGEASSLFVAGIVNKKNVLRIIQKRAEIMDREAQRTEGSMYALLGVEKETLTQLFPMITTGVVVPANFNTKGQIVISGDKTGIGEFIELLKKKGIKHRAIELKVSGAWHSPLMEGGMHDYFDFLQDIEFSTPNILFVDNVTGRVENDPAVIRQLVASQIISSVQWVKTMEILEEKAELFIEIGPGKVLNGLFKRYNTQIKCINIEKVEDLKKLEGLEV